MDRSVGSPRTRSVVGVRGPGVSVFGLPMGDRRFLWLESIEIGDKKNLINSVFVRFRSNFNMMKLKC